ncbi:hypothetical protein [Streptomyces sp. RG80]|uniref:hypothetical protein n=1 Tax=Streptomyces sp. RG80 TaxID=3157340 RepID=UPI00338E0BE5
MGLTDPEREWWDQLCDQLSLIQRWYTETAYVRGGRGRIDAKRVGLRTDTAPTRFLPVSAEADGTLRLTVNDADASLFALRPEHLVTNVKRYAVDGRTVYSFDAVEPPHGATEKGAPDLIRLLNAREGILEDRPWWIQDVTSRVLHLPQSPQWSEAVYTALLGNWPDPLTHQQELTPQAISVLRAEARTFHRQSTPLWRRRTRHGRVLSLDADLGDGYCLLDLLAAQASPHLDLAHWAIDDQRIGALLRSLTPLERRLVLARAAGEATTWTEAAMVSLVGNPQAVGDQVRRKVLRLIKEQERRREQSNGLWLSGRKQES